MKAVILFFLFTLISFSVHGQEITLLDNICDGAGKVYDFAIGPNKERFYLLRKARDTIWVNGEEVYLKDTCRNNSATCPSYLVAMNNNGGVSFVESLGFSGGQLIVKDSSVVVFQVFGDDSLFVADTFFVRPQTPIIAGNMVALEFSFDGQLLRAKHWPSDQSCWFSIDEVNYNEGAYSVSGTLRNDTLTFDGQTAPPVTMFNSHTDVFTAFFDSSWNCQWIRAAGGVTASLIHSADMDRDNGIYSTGFSDVGAFICGQDTMFGVGGWGWGSMWLTKLDSSGNCQWLKKVEAGGDGVAVATLSEGGAFIAGSYYSTQATVGDSIIQNPGDNRFYVMRYNLNAEVEFFEQFEDEASPVVHDIATNAEDAVWVCGGFANPWRFGDIAYPYSGNGGFDFDALLLKLDKNGKPEYATSLEGKEFDNAVQIESGTDNSVFVLLNTTSDTLWNNGEILLAETIKRKNVLLEIKETPTTIREKDPNHISLKIFPNPVSAQGELTYELSSNVEIHDGQITLYSMFGQVFYNLQVTSQSGQIDLPFLTKGIYFLQYQDQNRNTSLVSKLVVR